MARLPAPRQQWSSRRYNEGRPAALPTGPGQAAARGAVYQYP